MQPWHANLRKRQVKAPKVYVRDLVDHCKDGNLLPMPKVLSIIARVAEHVRKGGRVLVSVMNLELTESQAKHRGDVFADPGLLTRLPPSRTMQSTGNIFDPDYYLVDPASSIVYRKEQFEDDALLPTEVVVRDRRYRREELVRKFESVGIREIWSRYVQAGRWDVPLSATDSRAKEILFLGERE